MKVGLFFGSFNPVHTGHLIIASFVVNNTELDQVWLVVSPQNPLKPSKTLLNEYHRLHLVRLAVEGDPQLRVSDVEFKLPRPSYTIDTLTYLQEKYPAHQFSVIMGSDSYSNLHNWKNHELIRSRYGLIIYQRPGFPVQPQEPRTICLEAPLLEISATMIRQQVQQGKSIKYLVPEAVEKEISENQYYKN